MKDLDKFHRELKAGETLFHEGEPGTCAYVLEEGEIEVATTRENEHVVLAVVGPGALIGEMALINNRPRMATLTATQEARLIIITREYLADRLETADPMLRHILRVVLTRFREMINQVHGGRRAGESEVMLLDTADGEEDQTEAFGRLRVEQELELALGRGEFELFFQPIMRLSDGGVSGFEALIRWRKPDGTLVPPGLFIPVAEQSPLMMRIGHWIFDSGCAALRHLQDVSAETGNGRSLTMSVNLSAKQFGDPELFDRLNQALERENLDPGHLRVEITESMLLDSWDLAITFLNRCKDLGCKLAIDDFGTGYSSLSYLHKFPVDTMKLDQSFIREMFSSDASLKIVRALASLAHDLDMECIAEGIEEQMQGTALEDMGLEFVQGFFYGRPMPLKEAAEFLRENLTRAPAEAVSANT